MVGEGRWVVGNGGCDSGSHEALPHIFPRCPFAVRALASLPREFEGKAGRVKPIGVELDGARRALCTALEGATNRAAGRASYSIHSIVKLVVSWRRVLVSPGGRSQTIDT